MIGVIFAQCSNSLLISLGLINIEFYINLKMIMAEFINLHVSVTLKHILDRGPKLASENSDDSDGDAEEKEEGAPKGSSQVKLVGRGRSRSNRPRSDQLLDLDGPKLITGAKNWLIFYQLIGQINFTDKPLYVSIIFKLLILMLTCYVVLTRYIWKFFELHVYGSFKNPIFLFISCLAVVSLVTQILVTFYVNLFNLCPMYKILITPKLCFINTETQHIIGSKSLRLFLLFNLYTTFLLSLAATRSWSEFVNQFYLPTFVLEFYVTTVVFYQLIGLTHMDLYIRCSFGHWLLALKSHLERQFTYLHRHQRRSMRFGCSESIASSTPGAISSTNGSLLTSNRAPPMRFITLDEIQKNLNHMDDHLEVLRSIQISTLVLLTLNAFLTNGALFLLTYHLMADQSNYYHGFLILLITINYISAIFLSYSGDRWVFYALSSFVQTVEDEYFMQSDIKALDLKLKSTSDNENDIEHLDEPVSHDFDSNHLVQQVLLIKKKDVLFCREFLHQFENHLATPWSKLTFKSHLHMLRTFVTLIAAQIIFDHEH